MNSVPATCELARSEKNHEKIKIEIETANVIFHFMMLFIEFEYFGRFRK
jgi:hypothetical protein